METRTCTKCEQQKPLTDFHWQNRSKGIRNSRCKPCQNAISAQRMAVRYSENKRKAEKLVGTKLCSKCGLEKLVSEFNQTFVNKSGLRAACRVCVQSSQRAAYASNPEAERSAAVRYRQNLKLRSLEHYGSVCACCGESEILFLSIDHVDSDGAEHRKVNPSASNIHQWLKTNNYPDGFQVLCFNCNHGRHINGGTCPHLERTNQ